MRTHYPAIERAAVATLACMAVNGGFAILSRGAHADGADPLLQFRPALLVGAFGGAAGAYARMPSGFFLGADTGLATLLASDADRAESARTLVAPSRRGWAFGVRTGYAWASGLAIQARFDDLGVHTSDGTGSMMFASAGLRYALPFVVMPFAEALVGPAFDSSGVALGASLGVGASILVTRHLAIDLALRDWIADLDGGIRHIPTATLGLQIGFGR